MQFNFPYLTNSFHHFSHRKMNFIHFFLLFLCLSSVSQFVLAPKPSQHLNLTSNLQKPPLFTIKCPCALSVPGQTFWLFSISRKSPKIIRWNCSKSWNAPEFAKKAAKRDVSKKLRFLVLILSICILSILQQ